MRTLDPNQLQEQLVWTTRAITELFYAEITEAKLKATERAIQASVIFFDPLMDSTLVDEHARPAKQLVLDQLMATARKKRKLVLFAQLLDTKDGLRFLVLNDARGARRWIRLGAVYNIIDALKEALMTLCAFEKKEIVLIPSGSVIEPLRRLVKSITANA